MFLNSSKKVFMSLEEFSVEVYRTVMLDLLIGGEYGPYYMDWYKLIRGSYVSLHNRTHLTETQKELKFTH